MPIARPTHIFEVVPTPIGSIAEQNFRKHLTKDRTSTFAFHGSGLECFHSIVSYGLQQHLCKVSIYKQIAMLANAYFYFFGFCLFHRLFAYRTLCLAKEFTCLPSCMSAKCSVRLVAPGSIHVLAIACHAWLYANSSIIRTIWSAKRVVSMSFPRSKLHMLDTLHWFCSLFPWFLRTENKKNRHGVPDKYFVITNNEIVRVRYILAFGEHTNRLRDENGDYNNVILRWISNNKAITAMCLYATFLVLIGAANSRQLHYLKVATRRISQEAVEFAKVISDAAWKYVRQIFD